MITEMIRKQIGKEITYIFDHPDEFIQRFFRDAVDMMDGDDANLFAALTEEFIYVQIQWMERDGNASVYEGRVYYDDYNKWLTGE